MSRRKSENGQALVIVVLAMPFIFGILGLAIDVGYLEHVKRQMQTAADSAAMAGASEIPYLGSDTGVTISSAALAAAQSNGYASTAVTINNPPQFGPHTAANTCTIGSGSAPSCYVEAIVSQSEPTYFSAVFGLTSVTVRARAVATVNSGQGCIYALDPSGTGLRMNGNNSLTASCGVVIESNDNRALVANGTNTLNTQFISVVGNYKGNSAQFNPPPVTGVAPTPDPLSYLTPPTVSTACTPSGSISVTTSRTVTSTGCSNVSITGSGLTVTLSPGNWGNVSIGGTGNTVTLGAGQYGAVTVSASGGTVAFNAGQFASITGGGSAVETFGSGTYVIASGDFSPDGAAGSSGSGVTFYLGPNAGTLDFNGGNSSNFTAPTSGTYEGILLYQDPSDTHGLTLNGNSTAVFNGAVYCPTARITLDGNNSVSVYNIIVAYDIVLNGNDTVGDNYSSLSGGSPIKTSTLVE
jgi:Flp pilus assembly protein TadG